MLSSAHVRHFRLAASRPTGAAPVRLDAASRFHALWLYQEAGGQHAQPRYRPLA